MTKKLLIVLGAVALCLAAGCAAQNTQTTTQTTVEDTVVTQETIGQVQQTETTQGTETIEVIETTQGETLEATQVTEVVETTETETETEPATTETTPKEPQTTQMSDWERYNNMSEAEQQAFYESFANPQAFFDWMNAAKEEHDRNNQDIVVGEGGSIDLGDLGGNKP